MTAFQPGIFHVCGSCFMTNNQPQHPIIGLVPRVFLSREFMEIVSGGSFVQRSHSSALVPSLNGWRNAFRDARRWGVTRLV